MRAIHPDSSYSSICSAHRQRCPCVLPRTQAHTSVHVDTCPTVCSINSSVNPARFHGYFKKFPDWPKEWPPDLLPQVQQSEPSMTWMFWQVITRFGLAEISERSRMVWEDQSPKTLPSAPRKQSSYQIFFVFSFFFCFYFLLTSD